MEILLIERNHDNLVGIILLTTGPWAQMEKPPKIPVRTWLSQSTSSMVRSERFIPLTIFYWECVHKSVNTYGNGTLMKLGISLPLQTCSHFQICIFTYNLLVHINLCPEIISFTFILILLSHLLTR